MYLLLQGTPFIYQGQELGMTNMTFTDLDQLDDVTAKQQIEELRKLEDSGERNLEILELMSSISRDNSRTPMQWSTEENAGFSTAEPWLVVNPNYEEINVAAQLKQPNSILSYYKQLIQLRKNRAVFVTGHYHDYLLDDPKVYVYERFLGTERMLVVVNLTKDAAEIDLPAAISGQSWTLVIDNHSVEGANSEHELQLTQHQKTMALAPYEARVYHMNQRVKETFNEKIR
jgi:alpha-glucosidase